MKMPYVIILFKIKISISSICNYLYLKIRKCWTTTLNSAIITSTREVTHNEGRTTI